LARRIEEVEPIPKAEFRDPKEIRTPKAEMAKSAMINRFSGFVFRTSFGIRVSGFGFENVSLITPGCAVGNRHNWRLEAAFTGTLGSVPLRGGGGHPCLPVSAASSRVIHLQWSVRIAPATDN
jgi:hypothetical protein